MDLKGKTALVTGSAKRVGRVIALALGRRGANVVVHHRTSGADAATVVRELEGLGVRAAAIGADLVRAEEVDRLVAEADGLWGGLDILVNNASVFFKTPLASVSAEDWDRTLAVNLRAVFLCSVAAGRRMVARGRPGAIVSIADWAALRPYKDYLPYCISKAGVVAMTHGLARTLAPLVRVNAVGPGPVLVPADLPEDEAREILAHTPMKRHGSPEDVAAAVLYLLEGSDFTTGTFLPVDGGRLIA